MKQFNFLLADSDDAQKQNWTQLTNGLKFAEFDPFNGTTPVAEGFTNVTSYWGVSYTLGPICFVSISLQNNGGTMSWSAGNCLRLPYTNAQRGGIHGLELGKSLVCTSGATASKVIDSFNLSPGTDNLIAATTGVTNTISACISGWYFRA